MPNNNPTGKNQYTNRKNQANQQSPQQPQEQTGSNMPSGQRIPASD